MYIGNTQDGSGLHHMIYEVLDNAIDEHLGGHGDYITVTIEIDNWICIADQGRGVPVDIHEGEGISAAIVIMTQLHAGGKFDQDSYKISGGLHGVGVSVVNALSERLELTICRDHKKYFAAFSRGDVVEDLREIGQSDGTGTQVRFLADKDIFGIIEYDLKTVKNRIQELVYLNPGLKIRLQDLRSGLDEMFHEPDGVIAFVKHIAGEKITLHSPIKFTHKNGDISILGAAVWCENYTEEIRCFTNTIPQADGGTHLVGLRVAFTRCINSYLQKDLTIAKKMKDVQLSGEDVREGLVVVLAVYMPEPQFSSQTKEKLVSSNIRSVVESGVNEVLEGWFEENPVPAKKILQKIIDAALAREAARKSRDLVRNNRIEFNLGMASKLAGCAQKDPTKTELFLVEGESAGASAKSARNRLFQAVLPLRGKILNVEKSNMAKMIQDESIRSLIAVIGTGIGENFDITKIRYNKIIIMADADADGHHIFTLLATFFYRYMKPIIENGYLYVARPPLYSIKHGGSLKYFIDDAELAEFLLERSLSNVKIVVNEKNIDNERLRNFIKNLFRIVPDIKMRGLLWEAILCAKIDDFSNENFETSCDKLISVLQHLLIGEWTKQPSNLGMNFLRTYNGFISKYFLPFNPLEDMHIRFIRMWSDIWGIDVQIAFNEEAKEFVNPVELYDFINNKGQSDFHIQRYKGLGEMDADELAETAMRSYFPITFYDEAEIDDVIRRLMGDDPSERRKFFDDKFISVDI
jgi:DNA gyrase subunit B